MGSRPVLVIATRNQGKVREFRALLTRIDVELRDLRAFPDAPEADERHDSYLENAREKALSAARFTGLPALADDSGLEVTALGGAPGVRSARYAGDAAVDDDNVTLLLENMRNVPPAARAARFVCVIVAAKPNGATIASEGGCEGHITEHRRGAGGFGYDPVFYFPPAHCTFAELGADEKNRVSHRAHACQKLMPQLMKFLQLP